MAGALVLAACGVQNGAAPDAERAAARTADADRAIAEAVYLGPRLPAGFHREQAAPGEFQTIYHITSAHLGAGGAPRRLCSDDFDEALAWAETAARSQPVYRDLVDSSASALYFEFRRVNAAQPEVVHLARVFRCAQFVPAAPPLEARVSRRPLSAEGVRDTLEYRWWFSPSNNQGVAVLATRVEESGEAIVHTTRQAELQRAASGCDLIEVWRDRHRVDAVTGVITPERVLERVLSARFEVGIVSLCQ